MKKLIIILISICNLCTNAQIAFDTSIYHKNFLKLKNGEIYSDNINVESRSFHKERFFANGTELKDKYYNFLGLTNNYIEYYCFEDALYGRCYRGLFVPLVNREKRINFFSAVYIRGSHIYSYSRDLSGVKKLCTRNLYNDLTDDPKAFTLINKAHKSRLVSYLSFAASAASIAPLYFINGNEPAVAVLGIAAIGGIVNGIIFQIIRKRQTQHALIAYSPTLPKYQSKFFTLRQRKPFEEGGFLKRLFMSPFHS